MNKNFIKNYPLKYHKLKNGLQVCVVSNTKAPLISINLAYKVGSKDEVPGKTGLAHFFEHLMFEGSKNVPKGEFDRLCSLAGGINNAYTNYDLTSYTMTLPSPQLELALWLESDRMANFSVHQESLDTQKKVVIEELHQTVEDQPYGKWRGALAETAYNRHFSYSWEILGKKKDIKKFTLDDLQHFFEMFYQPDNACLVIAGDVEHDYAISLVEKYFGDIPTFRKKRQTIEFKKSFLRKGQFESLNDNVPLNAVFLAFHCPGFKNNEVLAGDIIANVAGNGRSSRLYHSLVYDKKMASQVGAFVDKREESSLIIFYAFGADESISCDMLSSELEKEILEISNKKINTDDFEKTINQITTQIANEFQYLSNITDILGEQILFWNNPERIYQTLDKYRNLTLQDLYSFSNEFIRLDEMIRIDVIKSEKKSNKKEKK